MFNLKPSLAMSKLRNLCESLKSDHFIKKNLKTSVTSCHIEKINT